MDILYQWKNLSGYSLRSLYSVKNSPFKCLSLLMGWTQKSLFSYCRVSKIYTAKICHLCLSFCLLAWRVRNCTIIYNILTEADDITIGEKHRYNSWIPFGTHCNSTETRQKMGCKPIRSPYGAVLHGRLHSVATWCVWQTWMHKIHLWDIRSVLIYVADPVPLSLGVDEPLRG